MTQPLSLSQARPWKRRVQWFLIHIAAAAVVPRVLTLGEQEHRTPIPNSLLLDYREPGNPFLEVIVERVNENP